MQRDIVVIDQEIDQETALVVAAPAWLQQSAEPDPATPFGSLYAESYGHHQRHTWQGLWDEAVERWLHSGRRRSDNTRRSYRHAVMEFKAFLRERCAVYHLWQINDRIVQDWLLYMQNEQGHAARTIGQRLAALSSLYTYCCNTKTLLNGREISLFVDAYGSTRGNPFLGSGVERPRVEQFSDVTGVPNEAYAWIIADLRSRKPTAANLRNLALMLMFGLNGWRNQEVISMKWGKINPNSQQKGQWTYRWTGKARNGEEEKRSLPSPNYDAIVAFLKASGRWNPGGPGHIQDDDYIWQPVRSHGCANFTNAAVTPQQNRHITQSTVNEILTSLLRRYYLHAARTAGLDEQAARAYAGEQAARYTIHSLRHMFAWNLYEASGHDIHFVSQKVGHKDISTTQIYLQHLKEPKDDHSALVAKQLGLSI